MRDHEPRDHRLVVIVRCEISEARADSWTPSHGGRISAILILEYLFELIQLDLQIRISHCSYDWPCSYRGAKMNSPRGPFVPTIVAKSRKVRPVLNRLGLPRSHARLNIVTVPSSRPRGEGRSDPQCTPYDTSQDHPAHRERSVPARLGCVCLRPGRRVGRRHEGGRA